MVRFGPFIWDRLGTFFQERSSFHVVVSALTNESVSYPQ